jgi:hypothetical protein
MKYKNNVQQRRVSSNDCIIQHNQASGLTRGIFISAYLLSRQCKIILAEINWFPVGGPVFYANIRYAGVACTERMNLIIYNILLYRHPTPIPLQCQTWINHTVVQNIIMYQRIEQM